jgi:hypothetical protein
LLDLEKPLREPIRGENQPGAIASPDSFARVPAEAHCCDQWPGFDIGDFYIGRLPSDLPSQSGFSPDLNTSVLSPSLGGMLRRNPVVKLNDRHDDQVDSIPQLRSNLQIGFCSRP